MVRKVVLPLLAGSLFLAGCSTAKSAPSPDETSAGATASAVSAEPSDKASPTPAAAEATEAEYRGCFELRQLNEGEAVDTPALATCLDELVATARTGKMQEVSDDPKVQLVWDYGPPFRALGEDEGGETGVYIDGETEYAKFAGKWINPKSSDPLAPIAGGTLTGWRAFALQTNEFEALFGSDTMIFKGNAEVAMPDNTVVPALHFAAEGPLTTMEASVTDYNLWLDAATWLPIRQSLTASMGGISSKSDRYYSDYGKTPEIEPPAELPKP